MVGWWWLALALEQSVEQVEFWFQEPAEVLAVLVLAVERQALIVKEEFG